MYGHIPHLHFPDHLRTASGFPDCLESRRTGARAAELSAPLDAAIAELRRSAEAPARRSALLEDLYQGLDLAEAAREGCEFDRQLHVAQRLEAILGALQSGTRRDRLEDAQLRDLRDEVLSLAAKSVERGKLGRLDAGDIDDAPPFRLDQLARPADMEEAFYMLSQLRRTLSLAPATLPMDGASLKSLDDMLSGLRPSDIEDLDALPRYRQLIAACIALQPAQGGQALEMKKPA
ncbi:MAG: hypothetical protein EOP37_00450 [Rubrivivax sp.]|nr:MAG: hypothetical protein EOP37_00450 [Rubrivivax sp.]